MALDRTPQPEPQTTRAHISTETLKLLAQQDSFRDCGEISPDHQCILAMYLPDIIAEVLEARAEQDQLAAFGFQPGQISF